jgi:DNA-binding transcriptional LysR family regulator
MDFGRLDLNLLLTLDALLTEGSVTRAAKRLHLSQPAVSAQLARLREALGDPLLLPAPRGMRPTLRAESLRAPLREALDGLARAIAPPAPFVPAAADRTWRVAASDYCGATVVAPVLAGLRAEAPGARLAILQIAPAHLVSQAESGEIDLAFHTTEDAPDTLRRRALFTEHYVLAVRAGHPRMKRRPTLAQFCALEHLVVSPEGGGFLGITDAVLAGLGVERRVAVSAPSFLLVETLLANSDLVAMLPARLARASAVLKTFKPPVEIPGYEMSMLWHERVHRDPAHQWLRGRFAALA